MICAILLRSLMSVPSQSFWCAGGAVHTVTFTMPTVSVWHVRKWWLAQPFANGPDAAYGTASAADGSRHLPSSRSGPW